MALTWYHVNVLIGKCLVATTSAYTSGIFEFFHTTEVMFGLSSYDMILCSLFKQSEILSAMSVSYLLISSNLVHLVLQLMRHWSILIAMFSVLSEKFFP